MKRFIKRVLNNKKLLSNFIFIILLLLVGIILPKFIQDPLYANFQEAFLPPSSKHLFGTDNLGRDVFSRVISGVFPTLKTAFTIVVIVFSIGTILGTIAGYFGGIVDRVIMRFADIMIAFPGLVLAIAIAGILDSGSFGAIFAISVVNWPRYARLTRSLVIKIKESTFIGSAKIVGTSSTDIILKYIIPNLIFVTLVNITLDIGVFIMEMASLSYLGFGAKPPTPEWGLMLSDGKDFIQRAPWLLFSPASAIFTVIVIFNLLGDNLRDEFDALEVEK